MPGVFAFINKSKDNLKEVKWAESCPKLPKYVNSKLETSV